MHAGPGEQRRHLRIRGSLIEVGNENRRLGKRFENRRDKFELRRLIRLAINVSDQYVNHATGDIDVGNQQVA